MSKHGYGPRVRVAPGIYRDAMGFSVRVTVGQLRRERRYPLGTLLREMQGWQDVQRGELRLLVRRPTLSGSWDADVVRYLAKKKATFKNAKSYRARVRELQLWEAVFRGRRRSTIQVKEVNDQLWDWRGAGLAASTVNHRLDAISNLFLVLDGPTHALLAAKRFDCPVPVARWIDRGRISTVLDALRPGVSRARLRLMHWTGVRPSQIVRLSPDSFVLDRAAFPHVLVPSGKGGNPIATPLVPEGVAAAREFLSVVGAWCEIPPKDWTSGANRVIAAACKRLTVASFTTYQIRHSFLRAVRAEGADLADVQVLAGHTNARTTLIYAPVVEPKLVTAVQRLSSAPPALAVAKPARKKRAS